MQEQSVRHLGFRSCQIGVINESQTGRKNKQESNSTKSENAKNDTQLNIKAPAALAACAGLCISGASKVQSQIYATSFFRNTPRLRNESLFCNSMRVDCAEIRASIQAVREKIAKDAMKRCHFQMETMHVSYAGIPDVKTHSHAMDNANIRN